MASSQSSANQKTTQASDNAADTSSSEPSHSVPFPSGLSCIVTIARAHGIVADPSQLLHEFGEAQGKFSSRAILPAARHVGLVAEQRRVPAKRLEKATMPAVFIDTNGDFGIIGRIDGSDEGARLLIHRPTSAQPVWMSVEDFSEIWAGELILFASRASITGELAKFDFSWFIPAMVKYRRLLLEVLVVSVVLQLFALVTPIFFQVVMDKVLVHRGISTLNVTAAGLLVVSVFEVVLSGLRTYVHAHTCSRIDVELGARLFRHLLALPLPWFQARRAGDAVARVRELEKIRQFLTGNGITLVLDLVFSLIFIGVMLLYSPVLTLIVVLSLPCYVLLSVLATPILRRRLDEQFKHSAENQALLVETVTAMGTVKAMAVEPRRSQTWEQQLAAYIKAAFRAAMVGNWAGNGVSLVSKLVTVCTLWLGARLVMEGEMSVGQLIAFNMLAGHVAAPVMRLAQMWSDFQQLSVSIERLGDILNTETEVRTGGLTLPTIKGHIVFDQVFFRYRPDGHDILSNIHLAIRPGERIGIVGRSGSGKSTLSLLLQRLHTAQRGRVLVDGIDIALADPASLRRQIGVVPQESQLFKGTVRQNIALTDPGAPLEKVMHMAQLAGAHSFITDLPEGYDTMIGEHGTGLSGGQKQRLAIARALMRDPRILIFDEATSALDYESERMIQSNMAAVCSNRTVIIIAHRLSAVRDTDRILVLEHGRLVEQGEHQALLAKDDGWYARLHRMQAA